METLSKASKATCNERVTRSIRVIGSNNKANIISHLQDYCEWLICLLEFTVLCGFYDNEKKWDRIINIGKDGRSTTSGCDCIEKRAFTSGGKGREGM